ncbi:MAG: alpha/beta fold hydrolase [Gammaproteobacteria bacterium]|nr:alpha/beta fold hydrolase [Gammaproteobacteria bacterium]
MKLHYQMVGSGQALVIIHGLFGSSDNWRALAKQLAHYAKVITVDLRNHGRSPHSPEQNYQLMSDDLAELLDDLNLDMVDIIGHSLGGKVAMAFSQRYPQRVRKLMVVDVSPRQYQDEHSNIFNALLGVNLSRFSRRNEVDEALKLSIPDKTVRQFLLMNLDVNGEQLNWRINLQALFAIYPQLLEPVCQNTEIKIDSCFIRGGRSGYVGDDDVTLISTIFPNAEIVTIEQAGHWVHAEEPQLFIDKVKQFFNYD